MVPNKHILLEGPPGVGKTTIVRKILDELKNVKIPTKGFFSEEILDEQNRRIGFDIVSTTNGESAPLARIISKTNIEQTNLQQRKYSKATLDILNDPLTKKQITKHKVGKYGVYAQILDTFAVPLIEGFVGKSGVLFVDEIGKMESFSKQLFPKILNLVHNENTIMVATCCSVGNQLQLVQAFKKDTRFRVISVDESNRQWLHEDIITHILPLVTN